MKICLNTPLPLLAHDLYEIVKLFWPCEAFAVNPAGTLSSVEKEKLQFSACEITNDMEVLAHSFELGKDVWQCEFTFLSVTYSSCAAIDTSSALQEKRMIKRLCCNCLYNLCKKITSKNPPWGSLTGVRPTRLIYEQIQNGNSFEQASKALVNDFDVNISNATLLSNIVRTQMSLSSPDDNSIDVYVSIPFCPTRCVYCSFPGEIIGNDSYTKSYLDALFYEMEKTSQIIKDRGLTLRALYIGGGTPTSLNDELFAKLINKTVAYFPNPIEFTVEAGRPDTITINKLKAMQNYNVTRISINPQTTNDRTLELIGRRHTRKQTYDAFNLARSLNFTNINMDLIAGLPFENNDDFLFTLSDVQTLAPESITVHTLAIKKSSHLNLPTKADIKNALPTGETVANMVQAGQQTAEKLGLSAYYLYRQKYMSGQHQNTGYCKSGFACLYNIDIMEEKASILAVGAGAISKRVYKDTTKKINRAPNVSNVKVYISNIEEMIKRKQQLFS